ncbi:MAG: hypothetical protein M1826_003647 [Phylliscum demangeonii]|nr:MAG: hypothetical protein M1826_003647 [Phylliscum demangeonii]
MPTIALTIIAPTTAPSTSPSLPLIIVSTIALIIATALTIAPKLASNTAPTAAHIFISMRGFESFRVLSKQGGVSVTCYDEEYVCKRGFRVRPSEEMAMRLVEQYTHAPVPHIFFAFHQPDVGVIGMSLIPGVTLKSVWDNVQESAKEQMCRQIWDIIAEWRMIPPPPELSHLSQCLADGSAATEDPLLKDLKTPPTALQTDQDVRSRIYRRYRHFNGQRYADTLPDMLPRSPQSVFTHGDIAPRNILVDSRTYEVTGVVDWECAGWYPDYWEYANIMKPSSNHDWQRWMERTAPQKWDISGIVAARRVLF